MAFPRLLAEEPQTCGALHILRVHGGPLNNTRELTLASGGLVLQVEDVLCTRVVIHKILLGPEFGARPIVEALVTQRLLILDVRNRGVMHALVVETVPLQFCADQVLMHHKQRLRVLWRFMPATGQ